MSNISWAGNHDGFVGTFFYMDKKSHILKNSDKNDISSQFSINLGEYKKEGEDGGYKWVIMRLECIHFVNKEKKNNTI